jgi:hypothetical protein
MFVHPIRFAASISMKNRYEPGQKIPSNPNQSCKIGEIPAKPKKLHGSASAWYIPFRPKTKVTRPARQKGDRSE